MLILLFILLLIVLMICAVRWGYDSTDKVDSVEWERRNCSHHHL